MLKEFSWTSVLVAVQKKRRWVAGCVLVALLIASCDVRFAAREYEATVLVAPSTSLYDQQMPTLSGSGLGSGLVSTLLSGNSKQPSGFDHFINMISSNSLAYKLLQDEQVKAALFPGQWSTKTHQWRAPMSFKAGLVGGMKWLLGFPAWQPPDERDMSRYLAKHVKFTNLDQSDLYKISYRHRNPAFARYMLTQIYTNLDDELKASVVVRIQANLAYINDALNRINSPDLRIAMTSLYLQEQKRLMLASSSLPLTADVIDPVSVGQRPVSPNIVVVYGAALFLGLIGGVLLAALLAADEAGHSDLLRQFTKAWVPRKVHERVFPQRRRPAQPQSPEVAARLLEAELQKTEKREGSRGTRV